MVFQDIFSKSRTKKQNDCPNPKISITIDTREKQSLIAANLIEKKANIEFEKLEIGDYFIGGAVIERKTFQDFLSSMINKRLIEQLKNLKKYENHFLIIEGFNFQYGETKIHENAIRGMLLSIVLDFKIPIIFTENEEDTSKFLILTAKKYEKSSPLATIRESKTLKSAHEQKKFILEGFPGIGATISKDLLDNFDSLKEIFNASEEDLKKIHKFDDNKIKKFKEILD